MEVKGSQQMFGYPHSSKDSFFYIQHKKNNHTDLEEIEGE